MLYTTYKIYAGVLMEMLRKKVEKKKVLPETQAEFSKGKGTMDNVYVLRHVMRKELRKKEGKVYGFFMDLRATFDRVDRNVLWEAMEGRRVRRRLIKTVKEIYENTKNTVRVQDKVSGWFWTRRGMRQGCPLNPLLFSILIADVEEEMKRG